MAKLIEIAVPEAEVSRGSSRDRAAATGVLIGFDGSGNPLVAPGDGSMEAVAARSTVPLSDRDLSAEVALLFDGGDPLSPIIVGVMRPTRRPAEPSPSGEGAQARQPGIRVESDGERIVLTAAQEIVLNCGNASIVLTRAGKVLIRGTYVVSRSTGVNRVKGGSVQIN